MQKWIRRAVLGVVAVVVMIAALVAPVASAAPHDADTVDVAEPSFPMPVRSGAFGYLATRSATLWLGARGADQVLASLPAPPQYSAANKQMAKSLDRELAAAVRTPGACLQIIVDGPDGTGGLFNYGFFAVEQQHCPK